MYEVISGHLLFIFGSLLYFGLWSSLCAYGAIRLELEAQAQENNTLQDSNIREWLNNIKAASDPLKVIGTLFSFSLVFRFNICYERWWEGRKLWGSIITNCLDLAIQVSRWLTDPELSHRFKRFLIVYSYACKSLLKHRSLGDDQRGDAPGLIERGLLTENELAAINNFPSWEPHFCIEMMRELLAKSYQKPGSFGGLERHKMQGQLYRCFDNSIKELNNNIGECISIQTAHLPYAYDGMHLLCLYLYFTLAPVVWATEMAWVTVPFVLAISFLALSFIMLGSELIDPFGDDVVDIPTDRFCQNIERQINTIFARRNRGEIALLAAKENATVKSEDDDMPHSRSSYVVQL